MSYKTLSLIAGVWLGSWMFACAAEAPATNAAPVIPEAIKAPATESLVLSANAKGFQVYESRAKKEDPTKFEWALKGPDAELFDASGKKIARHYAGPTWESIDGSKV